MAACVFGSTVHIQCTDLERKQCATKDSLKVTQDSLDITASLSPQLPSGNCRSPSSSTKVYVSVKPHGNPPKPHRETPEVPPQVPPKYPWQSRTSHAKAKERPISFHPDSSITQEAHIVFFAGQSCSRHQGGVLQRIHSTTPSPRPIQDPLTPADHASGSGDSMKVDASSAHNAGACKPS